MNSYKYTIKSDTVKCIIISYSINILISLIYYAWIKYSITAYDRSGIEFLIGIVLGLISIPVVGICAPYITNEILFKTLMYKKFNGKFKLSVGRMILVTLINVINYVFVHSYSLCRALIDVHMEKNNNDPYYYRNLNPSYTNIVSIFQFIIIITFVICISRLVWLKGPKDKFYKISIMEYEKFIIHISCGKTYKLQRDDRVVINKRKDLLIINSKTDTRSYFDHMSINYITDHEGKRIDY